MKTTTFLLACLSGLGVFTISEALKCYKGTTVADVNALTEDTCDSGVTVCKRYTLFGEIPGFMCGDTDDRVGDCTHTTALSVLLTETCFCEGDLCNSVNATFPKEKAMSGAGSVHPAAAIAAATVVAIAASIC